MIEKQVAEIYNKYKDGLLESIQNDSFYHDFVNMLRAGERTYISHHVFVERYIDEVWVNAIDSTIPYLSRIVNNPRQFLERLSDVFPVELAKKTNADTVKHLASNTQLIRAVENGEVIPDKLLSPFNEDTVHIYENRFIMSLLRVATEFVETRYEKLTEHMGSEKSSEFSQEGKFSQNGETTTYDMKIRVDQNSLYMADHNMYRLLFERILRIREHLITFNDTDFAKSFKNISSLKSPINKTNLLTKSADYVACYELWEFFEKYNKAGYKIKVVDINPIPSENEINEAEATALFYYLLLKTNMPGSREAREAEFRSEEFFEPKLVRKYNTKIEEEINIGPRTEDDGTPIMGKINVGLTAKKKINVSHVLEESGIVPESFNFVMEAKEVGDYSDLENTTYTAESFYENPPDVELDPTLVEEKFAVQTNLKDTKDVIQSEMRRSFQELFEEFSNKLEDSSRLVSPRAKKEEAAPRITNVYNVYEAPETKEGLGDLIASETMEQRVKKLAEKLEVPPQKPTEGRGVGRSVAPIQKRRKLIVTKHKRRQPLKLYIPASNPASRKRISQMAPQRARSVRGVPVRRAAPRGVATNFSNQRFGNGNSTQPVLRTRR